MYVHRGVLYKCWVTGYGMVHHLLPHNSCPPPPLEHKWLHQWVCHVYNVLRFRSFRVLALQDTCRVPTGCNSCIPDIHGCPSFTYIQDAYSDVIPKWQNAYSSFIYSHTPHPPFSSWLPRVSSDLGVSRPSSMKQIWEKIVYITPILVLFQTLTHNGTFQWKSASL